MPIKSISLTIFIFLSFLKLQAQEKPKLIVGIVVDQMRYEYLHRFAGKYGDNGFKKLMNEGFNVRNGHYNYIPTKTAPGHSSIYTGTTPSVHGVIANEWYDRKAGKLIDGATDTNFATVGSYSKRGQISPNHLKTTTITDELRLSNQMRSKVISISMKDRASVFPGGHTANAAFWYDVESGNFISSTYYIDKLPKWAADFNQKKLSEKYLKSVWNTKLPIEQYTESREDNFIKEGLMNGEQTPTFPHDYSKMTHSEKKRFDMIHYSPFSNTLVTDFALEALQNEKLGQGEYTDFLAISFSATDKVGHKFGPNSIEVEDLYLRLDDELERLLKGLDEKIGSGNYLVFLTADHAVADIPLFLKQKKIPSGLINSNDLYQNMNNHLTDKFGEGKWILSCKNSQVFLNWELISAKKIHKDEISQWIVEYLLDLEAIADVFTAEQIIAGDYNEGGVKGALIRGYNRERSGDLLFNLNSGWFDDLWGDGSDHSTFYSYDTHVPMLFYGWGIKKGSTVRYHPITDIAPTISTLLNIKFPSGCSGQPIAELFED